MNNVEMEMAGLVIKLIREILKEFKENGRYNNNRSSQGYSLLERRCGPARGTAYRTLPDPNPHQRRGTDVDSTSKAA
jgi:hypothetical protein